jgi:hypothetical protein
LRRGRWRRHPDRFDLGQAVGETFRHVCGHRRGRAVAVGDAHLAAMEALAAKSEGLSKIDRMQIDFALGKAYADLQDYPRSFRHLRAGNAAKRATIAYDEKATSALFGDIERIFASEAIKAKTGGGDPSQSPIFVVGMPRSGTTLIEQIIASHPWCTAPASCRPSTTSFLPSAGRTAVRSHIRNSSPRWTGPPCGKLEEIMSRGSVSLPGMRQAQQCSASPTRCRRKLPGRPL